MIIGLHDEERIKFKQKLLQVSPKNILEIVDRYFKAENAQPGIAVIAGEDHLKKANVELKNEPLKIRAI